MSTIGASAASTISCTSTPSASTKTSPTIVRTASHIAAAATTTTSTTATMMCSFSILLSLLVLSSMTASADAITSVSTTGRSMKEKETIYDGYDRNQTTALPANMPSLSSPSDTATAYPTSQPTLVPTPAATPTPSLRKTAYPTRQPSTPSPEPFPPHPNTSTQHPTSPPDNPDHDQLKTLMIVLFIVLAGVLGLCLPHIRNVLSNCGRICHQIFVINPIVNNGGERIVNNGVDPFADNPALQQCPIVFVNNQNVRGRLNTDGGCSTIVSSLGLNSNISNNIGSNIGFEVHPGQLYHQPARNNTDSIDWSALTYASPAPPATMTPILSSTTSSTTTTTTSGDDGGNYRPQILSSDGRMKSCDSYLT